MNYEYKNMFHNQDMMFIEQEHKNIKLFEMMLLKALFRNPEAALLIWQNIQEMKELINIIRGNYGSGQDTAVKKLFAWH